MATHALLVLSGKWGGGRRARQTPVLGIVYEDDYRDPVPRYRITELLRW